MNEIILQMWRVRAYDSTRQMTHSFRVAAESQSEAEQKVSDHLWSTSNAGNLSVGARPAGKVSYWQ